MGADAGPHAQTFTRAYGAQFERVVIWLLFNDKEFSEQLYRTLDENVFEQMQNALIFETGQTLFAAGQNTGYVGIAGELTQLIKRTKPKTKKHLTAVSALKRCISAKKTKPLDGAIVYVKNKIGVFLTKARTRDALLKAAELWEQDDFDGVLSEISDAVNSQSRTLDQNIGIAFNSPSAKLKLYTQRITATHHAPLDIPLLDARLRGGLEPGTLGVVMAPAKRGKSMFLTHAGVAALTNGLNVAVVSLELRDIDYSMRFDARLTGIPINEIADHPTKHKALIARCSLRLKSKLYIKHYGSNAAGISELYIWLKALECRDKFKPDVVLIDYVDLLSTSIQKREAPDVGRLTKDLRQLAEDFSCAVWTASQTRRSSYHGKYVELQDVAEDIQKVQIADVIIGIAQTQREREHERMRLILLGNRLGGGEGLMVDCIAKTETMLIKQAQTQSRTIKRFAI